MPKASRSRNRKINFKTRIPIKRGDVVLDDPETLGDAAVASAQPETHVETGVDKEEEHELHLQNVISASAASYAGRAAPASRGSAVASTSKVPMPHIPTPDATGLVQNWEPLYPKVFTDPHALIRFSDTVEDCIGVPYTMDEEDEDWLLQYNSSDEVRKRSSQSNQSPSAADSGSRNRNSPRKSDKSRADPSAETGLLSEDDFEMIMDHFEVVAEERVPMLHLDTSKIPPFSDFEGTLENKAQLSALKFHAMSVYPHWKSRRINRGGKSIIPQLDYDETREDNPYVCFRRREPKNVRKTRRSDAQNLERLIRLSTDLAAARDLMIKVLERETCKRDCLRLEHEVFEGRAQMRTLKRRVNEPDGDDNLLFGKTQKKRKLDDSTTVGREALKVPLRLSRPGANHTVPATPAIAEPIQPYRDRSAQITAQIDRDMVRKRELDRDYEDYTDGAYLPLPLNNQTRLWRAPDVFTSPVTIEAQQKDQIWTFGTVNAHALGGLRPSFRRRIGRSGRVFLDRLSAGSMQLSRSNSDTDSEDSGIMSEIISDRWKFDSDAAELPGAGVKPIIDDMDCASKSARISLFKPGDLQTLMPSTLFLEEAQKWITREPENRPVTKIHGSMTYRQPSPQQPLQSAAAAAYAQMQAQAAAVGHAQMPTPSQQAQLMSQMHANAAQISQMTMKRPSLPPNGNTNANGVLNGTASPGPNPVLRRMPSGQFPNALNGPAANSALAQWQAMSNPAAAAAAQVAKLDPAQLQQLSHQMSQLQQQQAGVNGIPFSRPLINGLPMNGLPMMPPPQMLPPAVNGSSPSLGMAAMPIQAATSSPQQQSDQLLSAPAPSPGLRSRRSPTAPSLKLGMPQFQSTQASAQPV